MIIGIYIGDYEPQVGGGFTFTNTLIPFLDLLYNYIKFDFEVVLLHESSSNLPLDYNIYLNKIKYVNLGRRSLLDKIRRETNLFTGLTYAFTKTKFQRYVSHNLDMVWFLSGGGYDQIDVPYISTVWDLQHRTHPWFPEVSIGNEWEKREASLNIFLKRSTYIICGTKVGADELSYYYQINRNRIILIPHPFDVLYRDLNTEITPQINNLIRNKIYLIYPAQFWPHKNHANLIKALKLYTEKTGNDIHLLLTGSNKGNYEYIKKLSKDLGLSNRVHFLGFIDRNSLFDLYKNAFAMIYPSISGPENLPPLEALSVACTVIMSEYPGAYEQIGDAAFYFNPLSSTSIADAIEFCFNNKSLREHKITIGVDILRSRTPDFFIQKVSSIFNEFYSTRAMWNTIK
jgi:glycosyltransferase involved in cell wall biosynthesis